MSDRMKVIWAPWRLRYIEQARSSKDCIFCLKPSEKRDFENFILSRSKTCFTIMNIFPYTNGHLMVAPYRHTADFGELTDSETLDLMENVNHCMRILKRALQPEGFNIGLNLGKIAGAGVEDHIHFHIVPRWLGDYNFMPVIGEVKVIPEHIETTFRKLKKEIASEESTTATSERRGKSRTRTRQAP